MVQGGWTVSGDLLDKAIGHHQKGNLRQAGKLYKKILKSHPKDADALHLLGLIAHQTGKHERARNLIEKAVRLAPGHAMAFNNLGEVHRALGAFEKAVESYRRAIAIDPGYAEAHGNLGLALAELGETGEAEDRYRQAIGLDPSFPEPHANLGTLLRERGDLEAAAESFREALSIAPHMPGLLCDLGSVLIKLHRREEAETAYLKGLSLEPDNVDILHNLGSLQFGLDKPDEAERTYLRGLNINPSHIKTINTLAYLYEKMNRLDDADRLVKRGLDLDPGNPNLQLRAAQLERRDGRIEDALARLTKVELSDMEPGDVMDIHFELGMLFDRRNKPDKAFGHFIQANNCSRTNTETGDLAELRDLYRNMIENFQVAFPQGEKNSNPLPVQEQTPLAFLVGFPRSGTTLLDQILNSHPNIATIEEQTYIESLFRELTEGPDGYRERLADLSPERIGSLRSAYFDSVSANIPHRAGQTIIDKYPLNIVYTGLIQRIFPEARFILAIRHPCDACLSCFMQNFKVNKAMANFFSLGEAVAFYTQVMGLWRQYRAAMALNFHIIRYEDVVDDMGGETAKLLDFLGLDWDDAVLDYRATAKSRIKINTPSYHQVTEPIYKRAKYRWQRYAKYFEPYLDELKPFIEDFGYSETGIE